VALETFNYLDSLVPANPTVSDGVVNGDDHIRGIKLALKNTFPNISGPGHGHPGRPQRGRWWRFGAQRCWSVLQDLR
jgi:hypothetical protein